MNIVYYIKEYFAVMFYFLVIFNVIISVIYSKSKKSSNKKSKKSSTKKRTKRRNRKGGSLRTFWSLLKIILCFLTFGLYCPGRGTEYFMWIFGDSDPRTPRSIIDLQDGDGMGWDDDFGRKERFMKDQGKGYTDEYGNPIKEWTSYLL